MSTIHIPDSLLPNKLANLATNALKCVLIDISTYSQAADTTLANLTQASGAGYVAGGQAVTSVVVAPDVANHWTTVTITPADWAGSTTNSATGAAIIDTTDGDKIIAVADFLGTVASSGGTYSVGPIALKFTGF